ncbi:MAG: L,D-transpeptidase family protein [Coriobacteriia bacterium]|nr:L,D-transpeptidase family protein [Coriobacteriia bacterium]
MYRDSLSTRILAVLLIASLAIFSVGFTWAAVDDYATRTVLPAGAAVDGVPIGGMPYEKALQTVEDKVRGPLLEPVSVTFAGTAVSIDPKEYVEVDVASMVAEAGHPKADSTLPERVWQRVSGAPVGHDVATRLKVDSAKLAAWATGIKTQVTVAAVDATINVVGQSLKFKQSKDGSTIEESAAVAAVTAALLDGRKTVALTEIPVKPRITDAALKKTIFVVRSKRSLTLYNGTTLEKAYRCAVGTPEFPTPLGWFKIVQKRYRPTWSNPGSDWAKSMPAYIPPGPGNPLGTRALNLDASGIRIHGTNKDYSIGTAASHGCMRMHMWDVEDLYDRVPVGTRVIIVR